MKLALPSSPRYLPESLAHPAGGEGKNAEEKQRATTRVQLTRNERRG
jgi:hypothetical protein